jgi:hypothetical protein
MDAGQRWIADQAAENLPALDPGSDIDGAAGPPWRFLLQALVQAMAVVVPGEIGQDLAEMTFAEDQDVVQALTAKRAHKPGVRRRHEFEWKVTSHAPARQHRDPLAVPGRG